MAINKEKKFPLMSEQEVQDWEKADKFRRKIEIVTLKDEQSEETGTFWIVALDRQKAAQLADMQKAAKPTATIQDLVINTGVLAGDLELLDWCDSIYYGLVKAITEKIEAAKKI